MYTPLTDSQWKRLEGLFPKPPVRPRRKSARRGGRPRLPDRVCFDAMLWAIFHSRAEDLPRELGTARTLRSRLGQRQDALILSWAWRAYLKTLPVASLRELSAALGRHRDGLGWQNALRRFLSVEHGPRMAAAALPPEGR